MSQKTNSPETMLAQLLVETFSPTSIQDVHLIMRRLFSAVLEKMAEDEMNRFLANSPGNYRNGSTARTVRSVYGELSLSLPRDRFSQFHSTILPSHRRTLPEISSKVKGLHALGCSRRLTSAIIKELYCCSLSYQAVSDILNEDSKQPVQNH
ncbi:transposase [Bariatricus massiliensis]|uniref:Mutator family transposase n=1 Tax=Bariatricus massiliensis TaxID=1745713 RepID=A0ABS8DKZ2_9FIRM|nr:transposase [Bariatricus massiliensis]MCB7305892.1 transposase [Bariatricus massiliensis]MCB7376518.1 transposase [Bariatricus massiliensis]MCB7389035.1 transposase [Bariatricus massiliensis]MCB7413208.1 transposase [Bariatricus massiliensis]MCQ5255104.1 transposase [Bariatricus massiliensis]